MIATEIGVTKRTATMMKLKPSEYQQDMVVSLAERAEGEAGNDKSKGCRRRNRKAYVTKDKRKRRNL